MLTMATLFGMTAPAALASPGDQYPYNQRDDKNFVNNTNVTERYTPTGSNNMSLKITSPRAQGNAKFTANPIVVDGIKEAAWDNATPYRIGNKYNTAMTATAPDATTEGTLRFMWDGPVLYVLVEVTGDTTKSDTGTPNWSAATYTPAMDGLFVTLDVFNDKWGMETDTQGIFFLSASPNAASVSSFYNTGIPSLGSFFNPNHQDYSTRLKAFKSSGYNAETNSPGVNYTYEMALQMEGWGDDWDRELTNGTQVGLDVGIYDQNASFTYWSKSEYYAGREGSSNLPNSERVRNRDWGEVTLSGWDNKTEFAYSGWRAEEDIRFWNSKNNPGGSGNGTVDANNGDGSNVWTAESKARMVGAKAAYNAIKNSPSATRAEKEAAVLEVVQAFAGLKWGNTKYPDPHDLPAVNTLPNVWQFFDKNKGTGGMVTNEAEWAQRKKEILELAQFYEYGYKPKLDVDYKVSLVTNSYAGTGNATVTAKVTPTNVNFTGGTEQNVTISITMPTAGVPEGQAAPISFAGSWTANGIANISFPNWAADGVRTDLAWGNPNRSGTFYNLFPYSRNNTTADVSVIMANATAVSAYLDILELAVANNPALAAKIDPTRAVTKGFSINGKYAFVAGVFDERVKAIVAGGAGATGPANWRYNAQGQEYNFKDTMFSNNNPGAENVIAHGTEGPGNSYRHNRTRETELFRHFLPYGHMYKHEENSYAYGDYSRLPFDQTSLVATLAPNRAIIIDTNLNDYNDGSTTDNMSLSSAKGVYKTLGVNGDDFVKFNTGNYVSSGDPHGAASATVEGKYLQDFFYGSKTLTDAEADRLNTDPYSLKVSNGQTQSPYDYYWGGFNTITGGKGGINGTNGWYYYEFPKDSTPDSLNAVLAGATNALAGASFDLTYGLSHVTDSIYAQDLTFTFDPEKVEFVSAKSLKDKFEIVGQKETLGQVRIIAANLGAVDAVNSGGDLLKLNFKAKSLSSSSETAIALSHAVVSGSDGAETTVDGVSHNVTISAIVVIDKTALNDIIVKAQEELNAATEGSGIGQYPAGSKAALQAAIDSANTVAGSASATQQQVDQAAVDLNAALQAFKSLVITRTPGDLSGDGKVTIGDLAIMAKYYGKKNSDPDWDQAKIADINGDGVIDINDLAFVARKILE
ncbi:glucuronyl esterase domain-containing protein [Paenibacillus planticolens]|nr:cohesin domain-containing protein [Paenibacillus planticolens]